MSGLFDALAPQAPLRIAEGAWLLPGFARAQAEALDAALTAVLAQAPLPGRRDARP